MRPYYNTTYTNSSNTSRTHPTTLLYRRTYTQPLNIQPSRREVETATQEIRYRDIVSPLHTICPISHEPFTDNSQVTMIRHCGHIFYTTQLNRWFENNYVCPVCRYDIRNYRTNNQPHTTNNTDLLGQSGQILRSSYIDLSNNQIDTDNITNELFNIFNSVLSLDLSYNNAVSDTPILSFILNQYTTPSRRH
jgi:hypothetical protein